MLLLYSMLLPWGSCHTCPPITCAAFPFDARGHPRCCFLIQEHWMTWRSAYFISCLSDLMSLSNTSLMKATEVMLFVTKLSDSGVQPLQSESLSDLQNMFPFFSLPMTFLEKVFEVNLSGPGRGSSTAYLMWFKPDNVDLIFVCTKLKMQAALQAQCTSIFIHICDIFLCKTFLTVPWPTATGSMTFGNISCKTLVFLYLFTFPSTQQKHAGCPWSSSLDRAGW